MPHAMSRRSHSGHNVFATSGLLDPPPLQLHCRQRYTTWLLREANSTRHLEHYARLEPLRPCRPANSLRKPLATALPMPPTMLSWYVDVTESVAQAPTVSTHLPHAQLAVATAAV